MAGVSRNKVFISYSHRDARYLHRLRVHLRPLEREHEIEIWDDTCIRPGSDWKHAISESIGSAKVAILLISADFLASDFIFNTELPPLLEAARSDGATIFCVILSHSRFEKTPELSRFQAINDPSIPLAKLPVAEREAVWVRLSDAVEAAFLEKPVAEGWRVRNARILFEALEKLVHKGRKGAFLVATAGDYYVQFLPPGKGGKALYAEAVSNAFLPEKLHLTKRAVELLVDMGFAEPTDNNSNFHKTYEIKTADQDLRRVAEDAADILANVYKVSDRSKLEIDLDLG